MIIEISRGCYPQAILIEAQTFFLKNPHTINLTFNLQTDA